MASALETLCGQAFGAKKYYMLGVYMQRWWIVLFICCVLLFPLYLFASPVLKLLGQPDDVAELSRMVSIWMAPLHFTFTFQFPLKRFLLSQLKNMVIARGSLVALLVHIFVSWLFLNRMQLGVIGTAATLTFSWWVLVFGLFGYVACGGCPLTGTGFSLETFSGLWEFAKLSAASGVILWLPMHVIIAIATDFNLIYLSLHFVCYEITASRIGTREYWYWWLEICRMQRLPWMLCLSGRRCTQLIVL